MSSTETTAVMCPVCTLYLRPGITLKQHLGSHPKQKVIDALVKASTTEQQSVKSQPLQTSEFVSEGVPGISQAPCAATPTLPPYLNQIPVGQMPNVGSLPGNHFFIYQQSMSTSSPHPTNVSTMGFHPFTQQYLVPAVYSTQMMPYFYQQQQLILSSNGITAQHRALPFDGPTIAEFLPSSSPSTSTEVPLSKPDEIMLKRKKMEDDDEKVTELEGQSLNDLHKNENCVQEQQTDGEIQILEINNDGITFNEEHDGNRDEYQNEAKKVEETEENDDAASVYGDIDETYENREVVNGEYFETGLSNASNSSQWNLSSTELNKACQTQNSVLSPPRSIHDEDQLILNDSADYYYLNQRNDVLTSEEVITPSYDEQTEPIYSSSTAAHNPENTDFVNAEDLEQMQIILNNYSATTSGKTEAFDELRQDNEEEPILIPLDNVDLWPKQTDSNAMEIIEQKNHESDNDCIDNVNIRTDEKMPPRGELSGQESVGSASDITWNQLHYQSQPNSMCFEHNSWDSTSEINSYSEETDNKEIVENDFLTLKEEDVKENIIKQATEKKTKAPVLETIKKKPKESRVKQKKYKIQKRSESNINNSNTFSNKFKLEGGAKADTFNTTTHTSLNLIDKVEIKTEEKPLLNACKECNMLFKTKKELKSHNTEFHNLPKMKGTMCQICKEVFDVEHKFNEHLRIHPLECQICGKLFYRRQGLKLHLARHAGIKPHECELCDKAFLVKQKLEEHKNCHTGNAPLKCNMCNLSFRRHSNLAQHRNRHHLFIKKKDKDYICYCGQIFNSKKKFAWHKEIHDTKPKACIHCSEKFIHAASLTRHMRRAHNAEYLPAGRDPNSCNRSCPICKRVCLKTSLEAHLKTHKTTKQFICSVCNKEFTTKWNLKLHKWTHVSRTQKPFRCDQCKSAFIRETDYVAHMNSHKSVRPYTCNYCGAKFIRKYNCQRHVKEHENKKTYVCTICSKSFHRSYYLKDHLRVHSGVRPFACHICGKTSTTKSNHNKHIQIHHARDPVSTEN